MNLDNFSEKLRITVDAAFNYAKENSFNYFFPIHILIILLQDDDLISKTLKELKINKKALLDESIKISNEQNNNSKETQVQSNVILLLNKINDQISKYKVNNSESLVALMELASGRLKTSIVVLLSVLVLSPSHILKYNFPFWSSWKAFSTYKDGKSIP